MGIGPTSCRSATRCRRRPRRFWGGRGIYTLCELLHMGVLRFLAASMACTGVFQLRC